ncbi:uncharacterized protein LDX57_011626 [Aspergillus melleus]|uniref:uncharacterized protein n=1 Tax=Aspergillus melleus TaxID=138277 RepID=UPI001E8CB5E6|nr:uncharacterized protein LDX57_011626 [Aspergillus melleus]KAH8433990.1 hypothetical protein LDX57_011626 [Aspergillus melleus]
MAHSISPPQSFQAIELHGHEIVATEIELLDQHRPVYRARLEPDLYRHTIPSTVTSVIIKQQKDEWEEEFEDEEKAYNRLKKLQGEVIPYFYGRGCFNGQPALILSDIDGITLNDLAHSNYDVPEASLKAHLEEVFDALSTHGALYRDQKPDNFFLCGDCDIGFSKAMVVDLEQVEFPGQLRPWQYSINKDGARALMEEFKYKRDPQRESTPLDLWTSGHQDGNPLRELEGFASGVNQQGIGRPEPITA